MFKYFSFFTWLLVLVSAVMPKKLYALAPIVGGFEGDILMGYTAPKPPAALIASWATELKASVHKINTNRTAAIPDSVAYADKVVTPSIAEFVGILNPAKQNKHGVQLNMTEAVRAGKLNNSYTKWLNGIQYMFGTVGGDEGKIFKEAVTAKSGNWEANFAAAVFPTVGSKNTTKGPGVFAVNYLTGLDKANGMLPAGWTITGASPYRTVTATQLYAFRAAALGSIVQAVNLVYITGFNAMIMSAVSAQICALMNSFNDVTRSNAWAIPDVDPTSSIVLSQAIVPDTVHVKAVIRLT